MRWLAWRTEPARVRIRQAVDTRHQEVHAAGSVVAPATSGEREEHCCGRRFVPAAGQRSQPWLSLGGVSNPPVWTGCRPRPRPGGLLTPRCPRRNARGFSLRSVRRMHAGCHVRTRRRSVAKRIVLSNHDSRQKSAITVIRIVLCSASSRLSLRSTLRAAALTPPPRSSSSHLCDGRRSSPSFRR